MADVQLSVTVRPVNLVISGARGPAGSGTGSSGGSDSGSGNGSSGGGSGVGSGSSGSASSSVSFGAGAPAAAPTAPGQFYFDDSTNPLTGYIATPEAAVPSIVQSATVWTNASSLGVALPAAPSVGNLLLLFFVSTAVETASAGWADTGMSENAGTNDYLQCVYRYAVAGDGAALPSQSLSSYGAGVAIELTQAPSTWSAALDTWTGGNASPTAAISTSDAAELAIMFDVGPFFGGGVPAITGAGWTSVRAVDGPIYPVGLSFQNVTGVDSAVSATVDPAAYLSVLLKGVGAGLAWKPFS